KKAKKLVDQAKRFGAEIIKHQTHIVEDEMSIEAREIVPSHTKKNIFEIIENSSLSEKDEFKLMKYVQNRKMIFISTPFSRAAVDRLIKFKVPAFKIGSGECNNYPLIEYIAKYRKPVILSTGMNTIESIKPSVKILEKYKVPYALMHCTNIYPTPTKLIRLQAISKLKDYFPNAILGLSDHSKTIYPCIGAIALGASIVEKHFVDKKSRKGPDISASMDGRELKILLAATNEVFLSKGNYKGPVKEEKSTIKFAFASLVATKNIKKGEKITKQNIFPKRPGVGDFKADSYYKLIGKTSKNFIRANTLIKKKDIY
ncbi:MAG: N-acetylneuraminate synthase family protein, partial [Flavobacteriaceae bacterium]|nr:N-acetylneuraminate synthase family protein [Flavobacteriaceae bacterium]